MTRSILPAILLMVLGSAGPLSALQAAPIQDNSFLIEEAYNQEAGIVQHISLFQRARHGNGWAYGFTQEWPFPNQRHQLGFTLPVVRADQPGMATATGIGDVLINYRYQAVGGAGSAVWLAPRASLVLPSGSWRSGRGDGSLGLQLALPTSFDLLPTLAAHASANLSLHRRARNLSGDHAAVASLSGGASLVWLPRPGLNFLTEVVIEDGSEVVGSGVVARRGAVFLAPGVRWAHNLRNGMQIVPGVAYAVGLGHARDDSALLVYLSVEHSFRR
ncbi:MAG: transporter [Gemmatimonadota bacterium]|nr:transporter [Gemmatimonadota bacterium]